MKIITTSPGIITMYIRVTRTLLFGLFMSGGMHSFIHAIRNDMSVVSMKFTCDFSCTLHSVLMSLVS